MRAAPRRTWTPSSGKPPCFKSPWTWLASDCYRPLSDASSVPPCLISNPKLLLHLKRSNLEQHWFTIRKLFGEWYNCNSLFSAPQHLSQFYLSAFLGTLLVGSAKLSI